MKKIMPVLATVVFAVLDALHLDSPNRIVVALSPLFTAAAAAVTALVAHYLPVIGHRFTSTELSAVFIAGGLLAATKVLMWLHGWQLQENRPVIQNVVPSGPPGPMGPPGPPVQPAVETPPAA